MVENVVMSRMHLRKKSAILLLSLLLFHFISLSTLEAADEGGVFRATLKNGLGVVIIRNMLAPVVTTQVNYLVGGNEDPPGLPGAAHAQEHMMFRGSPALSADQISAIIASLGGEFNADTQQTVTQYFFTIPAADLDVALRLEAVRMRKVIDSQTLWTRERGAIEQEVAQDLSDPEYVFYRKLLALMFDDTPYARDALGTRESFEKLTGNELKKFHNDWYGPNNAVLVIAGNVDPVKTLKLVRQLFEGIPPRATPPRPDIHLKPLRGGTISLETDLSYGIAVLAYRLPGYDSPDYAAGQILGDILESKRGNLYALVPQGKALSVDVGVNSLPGAAIGYIEAAYPKGEDGTKLIAEMKRIVEDYLKDGFSVELMQAAKRLEIADDQFQMNSVEGLASLWSQALAVEGRESPEDDIEAIRRVSLEDVNRVARTYLVNDTAISAILEPRASGETGPSKSVRGKESFATKHTRQVRLPSWAKKAASLPVLPVSSVNPVVTILPNGLRLIVQPENVSGTVSVFGKIKNKPELEVPRGREGVDRILEALFSYGTKKLDRLAFQKALDDIAARESAGTSFSLQVLSEHFERGMELLADNLLHPALPEDAFRVVQQETAGALAGLLDSPSYLSGRALLKGLYPGNDPALRHATPDSVAKLSLDDVREYHRKVFRPDMTTIVVIGRLTPDRAKAVVEKYFGEWRAEGPKPETDLQPVPLNIPSSATVPDTSRVQDAVTLAETVDLKRANPEYYALEVGGHILSGGFYATRLYQDLRERTGLVYTVEAFLDVGRTRSTFGVFYACDPHNVAGARAIIEKNLREMRTRTVSPKELLQAKTLLLRQISLGESSVRRIAERLLRLSLEGLPLDEPKRAAKRYREITASEVRSAFARWIRSGDFVQVTLGPSPE